MSRDALGSRESYAWAQVWAASSLSWRHLGCLDAILALDLWLLGTWGDSFVRVVNASLLGHRICQALLGQAQS